MNKDTLIDIYKIMIKIRMSEETVIEEYDTQQIKTPVHLSIGQEAIPSAISINLMKNDQIASNHRCHGHALAKGLSLEGFFKEIYGKKGGCTGGKGGSMHLIDDNNGILGTSAIVGGWIPIGAGVALKQKIKNEKNITVIYFGDGSVDEGVFWETLNIASLMKLPILFVMEDNNYASQTNKLLRHGYNNIVEIVEKFNIKVSRCDGNDVEDIYQTSLEQINYIRNGNGPTFMYCETYRWLGHVGHTDDTQTGYRNKEEVLYWKDRCPIKNIENKLLSIDAKYTEEIRNLKTTVSKEIKHALLKAKEAEYAVD